MNYLKLSLTGLAMCVLSCMPPKRCKIETYELCDYPCDYVHQMGQKVSYSLKDNLVQQHEIRLWARYEPTNLTELYTLKDVDSLTFLTSCSLLEQGQPGASQFDSLQATVRQHGTSAKALTNQLYKLGFRNMVSQPDSIKQRIGDGVTYIVELRDTSYYKLVFYNSPHFFDDQNHQSFMKVLKVFEQEFDWEY